MPKLQDTERHKTPDGYREAAYPGGLGNREHKPEMKTPAGRLPRLGPTQTTRGRDSQEYAGEVYPGGGGRTVYGESREDEQEAQRGHREFKEALMRNVNGLGFKNNDRHDGSMHNQNDYIGDLGFNPAVSEKQRRYMGAEYERAKRGQPTETGMSKKKLREFARKPRGR